jgi:hypothetical protein
LEVLDERQLQTIPHVVPDDRGDRGPAREPCREDAAVTGHELVTVAGCRYHYRLQNAMASNGGGELGESLGLERGTGLVPVRTDRLERDLVCGETSRDPPLWACGLAEENVEAPA